MSIEDLLIQTYSKEFGKQPGLLVTAPGRVNLIGEHTDYNDGYVMPLAIDRAVRLAISPRDDQQIILYSLDFNERINFSLSENSEKLKGWQAYVQGVAWSLVQNGNALKGFQGFMKGDIPMGSGLSSSAALEMAIVKAFMKISGLQLTVAEMAKIGQHAENSWVGVNCGIMDQLISAGGKKGHALLIDCRSLTSKAIPIPKGCKIAILDTSTHRGLVDSAYNERRTQCEKATQLFNVAKLRDVNFHGFRERTKGLDPIITKRAKHVITENERTVKAADVMQKNDPVAMGQLMDKSHESLRDDFEVSSPALDAIVECARKIEGCYGARLTGAGFGGCAVALIDSQVEEEFIVNVKMCYKEKTNLDAVIYICDAADGADVKQLK